MSICNLISLVLSTQAFNAKAGKSNVEIHPILIIIIIVIVLALLESAFLIFWIKPYFKYGIIVLKKTFNLPTNFDIDLKDFLDTELFSNEIYFPIKIKRLDKNNFALREVIGSKILRLSYITVMRGLIKVDCENNNIIIEGRLTYSLLFYFVFTFYLFTTLSFDFVMGTIILLFIFFMLFWSYSIQKKRFISILQKIVRQYTT